MIRETRLMLLAAAAAVFVVAQPTLAAGRGQGASSSSSSGGGCAGRARPTSPGYTANPPGGQYAPNNYRQPNPPSTESTQTTLDTASAASANSMMVEVAKAELAAARTEQIRAAGASREANSAAQAEFDGRLDVAAAKAELAEARAAYEAAARPVLAGIELRGDYVEAVLAVNRADTQSQLVWRMPEATVAERTAAAKELLGARDAVAKLKAAAIAGDTTASAARAKYVAAGEAVAALVGQRASAIAQSPQLAIAKEAVAAAGERVAAAERKLAEARGQFARAR